MKSPLPILLLAVGNVLAQMAPALERAGAPFVPANCEVEWSVPTNHLLGPLWVYKTIPQHFPDQAVSNLVALGSFTARDREKITDEDLARASAEERAMATDVLAYESEDERRNLVVCPATGYIFYIDQEVDDVHCPIEDVPSEAKAQELGLKLFAQFGFSRPEIVNKPNSSEPLAFKEPRNRSHFDREQGKLVKDGVYSRGVFFVREIDGVSFAGIGVAGGFYVRFASHAKVAELELVWRNLQPYKRYQVASPAQILRWIREGKAVMPGPNVEPGSVKKLTITDISPLYMGELGEKPQEFTHPFANLGTLADTGQTNISVQLYCPILTDKEVSP
ncbi:MAG TPA: hypothetical protein VMP11_09010 [Verrucomicrobiae bacterium]|nr:hypothetical protein [Verrucomicrobiae bacterium]